MAPFRANLHRFDPYKNFKFRVVIDGRGVAGLSKVSGLKRTSEDGKHHAGIDTSSPRIKPSGANYQAITLERGLTHDPEFQQWVSTASNHGFRAGTQVPPEEFRKDIVLELYDEAGQFVTSYKIFRCWVSEYQAVPDLDANAVAIAHIRLENEGWERDSNTLEPVEPFFT